MMIQLVGGTYYYTQGTGSLNKQRFPLSQRVPRRSADEEQLDYMNDFCFNFLTQFTQLCPRTPKDAKRDRPRERWTGGRAPSGGPDVQGSGRSPTVTARHFQSLDKGEAASKATGGGVLRAKGAGFQEEQPHAPQVRAWARKAACGGWLACVCVSAPLLCCATHRRCVVVRPETGCILHDLCRVHAQPTCMFAWPFVCTATLEHVRHRPTLFRCGMLLLL